MFAALCSPDADNAGLKLLRGLQTVKFDVEEMRRQEKDLPPADGMSFRHVTRSGCVVKF